MESLSSYARQFLGQMEKPDVESIEAFPRRFDRSEIYESKSEVDSWNGDGDL